GLPAYRQSLQDAPDTPLLEAMAAAACAEPSLLASADGAELARLAEEAGRDDLLRALGAAAGETGRARLLEHGRGAKASLPGLAHAATHRPARAALAFAAAHAAEPEDASARFNAGYAALAAGDAARAAAILAALPAAGEAMMAGAAWPHFGELPWPFAAPPEAARAAFEALLPPGARWPRIRLVTPCLNPGPWLEETILSVARQDYPAVEHVVVDGGSTDGTAAILARHRDRLHAVLTGPDSGPAEAIARGLAGSEADLLGWINADDLLAPGALHHLGAAWAARPDAGLVHGFAVIHRARRITGVQRALADGPQGFTPEGLADVFGRWGEGAFFLQPEVLVARHFHAALGGLDASLGAVFDYEFWLRAAAARPRIASAAWPAAFYRTHPAQRSGRRAALAAEQV
ncbi:glycosyltransferase, partial [Roseomonas alkaliterrae]